MSRVGEWIEMEGGLVRTADGHDDAQDEYGQDEQQNSLLRGLSVVLSIFLLFFYFCKCVYILHGPMWDKQVQWLLGPGLI